MGNKNSVVNFGVGWVTIIYGLLMFWFYVGMCNDGSNITVSALAIKLGVENPTLLNINTAAGVLGVLFFILMGQINHKIGARLTAGICMIISGVAYIFLGWSVNLPMYMICMCCVAGGVMSAGYIGGAAFELYRFYAGSFCFPVYDCGWNRRSGKLFHFPPGFCFRAAWV